MIVYFLLMNSKRCNRKLRCNVLFKYNFESFIRRSKNKTALQKNLEDWHCKKFNKSYANFPSFFAGLSYL